MRTGLPLDRNDFCGGGLSRLLLLLQRLLGFAERVRRLLSALLCFRNRFGLLDLSGRCSLGVNRQARTFCFEVGVFLLRRLQLILALRPEAGRSLLLAATFGGREAGKKAKRSAWFSKTLRQYWELAGKTYSA